MVIDLVRSVGSANVCFRINERTCVAQPPISFTVSLVLSATNSTLESQAVN